MVDILESKVVGTNKETWYKLIGTSEDTKPIGEFPAGTGHTVAKNSTFFEIGTQIKYEFDGTAWTPKGQVDIKLIEKTITESGTYDPADDDADGYSSVTVNIPQDNNGKFTTKYTTDYTTHWCLNSLDLPESVTKITGQSFLNYRGLEYISIPSGVQSINSSAFQGCINLATIRVHKPQGSISGAPWAAPNAEVIWDG